MVSAIPVLRLDPLASARSSNRPAPETGGTMTSAASGNVCPLDDLPRRRSRVLRLRQQCSLGSCLPARRAAALTTTGKQGGDQVQRDSWHVAGVDAMFMGQCQQGWAVRERRNDHHASRYHDQHKADGKASSASRSALGCSLAHVGRLLQRSPRKACGSTPGGSRCQSRWPAISTQQGKHCRTRH
jgi:hypothetical protein